jgi:hypothetical protein
MPRHNPSRSQTLATVAGPRLKCYFCSDFALGRRLACRSCWGRLQSAPGRLRDRLISPLPEGENPRTYGGKAYRAALGEAVAWLEKVRSA